MTHAWSVPQSLQHSFPAGSVWVMDHLPQLIMSFVWRYKVVIWSNQTRLQSNALKPIDIVYADRMLCSCYTTNSQHVRANKQCLNKHVDYWRWWIIPASSHALQPNYIMSYVSSVVVYAVTQRSTLIMEFFKPWIVVRQSEKSKHYQLHVRFYCDFFVTWSPWSRWPPKVPSWARTGPVRLSRYLQ